jgi:hypothetical protein
MKFSSCSIIRRIGILRGKMTGTRSNSNYPPRFRTWLSLLLFLLSCDKQCIQNGWGFGLMVLGAVLLGESVGGGTIFVAVTIAHHTTSQLFMHRGFGNPTRVVTKTSGFLRLFVKTPK